MIARETMSSIVTRRQILLVAAAAAFTWGCSPYLVKGSRGIPEASSSGNVQPISGPPLRVLAERARISIGAAVMPECLDEAPYAQTLSREFSMLTPENHLKWEHVHPARESYDFSAADRIISFAENHQMKVRGHTLLWHKQLPQWLTSSAWNKNELEKILEDHIKAVVGRYAGRIQYWDVVNEAIEDWAFFTFGLRKTFWYRTIGKDYIEKAFIFARKADPKARLFINEYGAEEMNAKSNALYALVKDLRARGVPVDGVGFQLHLQLSKDLDFESFERNLKRFMDLGVEIHFTEVDVAISGEVDKQKLAQQAMVYRKLMTIALKYPQIKAFLTWGLTDKYSWLSWFGREIMGYRKPYGSGLLFGERYDPKPAYFGMLSALRAHVK